MSDLFSSPAPNPHYECYCQAFAHWHRDMHRKGRITGEAAAAVYEDMWRAFAHHAARCDMPVALEDVSVTDIEAFVLQRVGRDGGQASARYVWRLLHLIDRVLTHHAVASARPRNTAAMQLLDSRPQWRYANARRGEVPDYLGTAHATRLVRHLSDARPRPGRQPKPQTWQELRNAASVALQLGGGLTPAEVRELSLACVATDAGQEGTRVWKVRVPALRDAPARETPVAPWAGQLLAHWLLVRRELAIPGAWLFPSTRKGTQWGKPAQYNAARAVLVAAGWPAEDAKGGSFRLRHTFAVRQLRKGFTESQVATWLGVEIEAMGRYRSVILEPVAGLD